MKGYHNLKSALIVIFLAILLLRTYKNVQRNVHTKHAKKQCKTYAQECLSDSKFVTSKKKTTNNPWVH